MRVIAVFQWITRIVLQEFGTFAFEVNHQYVQGDIRLQRELDVQNRPLEPGVWPQFRYLNNVALVKQIDGMHLFHRKSCHQTHAGSTLRAVLGAWDQYAAVMQAALLDGVFQCVGVPDFLYGQHIGVKPGELGTQPVALFLVLHWFVRVPVFVIAAVGQRQIQQVRRGDSEQGIVVVDDLHGTQASPRPIFLSRPASQTAVRVG